MDLLHNSYVKCGIALLSLFGPGRGTSEKYFLYLWNFGVSLKIFQTICNILISFADILFDGVRAFKQGSPNMNSLVGFGSIAAFIISTVSGFS